MDSNGSQIFGHNPWTVSKLVNGVDDGTIRLPDIQRPFVWRNAKVRDLIDSMYRGYPVGELMFWKSRNADNTRTFGGDEKDQDVSFQVVDGQQRLTSLYAIIKGVEVYRVDYSREAIRIAFNPLTERFDVPTKIIDRSPEWIKDIRDVFDGPIVARRAYLQTLREHTEHPVDDPDFETRVENAINRVAAISIYQFSVVQIDEDIRRDLVADIFVRTNSEGVNLVSADFILTWLSVFWEDGRRQLDDWARRSRMTPTTAAAHEGQKVDWTPHNAYMVVDPDQILRVAIAVGLKRGKLETAYNVLRGRDPRTREIHPEWREEQLVLLKAGQATALNPLHWDEFLRVLERAGFRNHKMVSSKTTVLYTYAIWLIGRTQFKVPVDQLREIMARWFFMSQITYRYTSSAETRIQEDINRLEALEEPSPQTFVDSLAAQINAAAPSDWWTLTLPGELETSAAEGPTYSCYIAALNILDAEVLLSTSKLREWTAPRAVVKGIEKHHLFPKAYLRDVVGIKETRRINQVANMAMVEWSDNIDISDDAPNVYWPREVEKKRLDDARQRSQQQWHALPDGWPDMPYSTFLQKRRELIAKVTHEGFKRLSDPNYVPDLSRLEEPPPEPLVLPTFEAMVRDGVVASGALLAPVNAEIDVLAEVLEDGSIRVGSHVCETLDQAAREVAAEPGDGWEFWALATDGDEEPEPLSLLRENSSR